MDSISEARLAQVHPELSRRIHQLAEMLPYMLRVTQGLRTYAEQNALYDQGRTTPGKIVTEAKGGYSMHNFGLAVDVVPMSASGQPDWNDKDAQWAEILAKAPACGLAEGAAWRTFPDEPHLYPQEVPASPDDNMRYLFNEGGVQAVWDALLPAS
jgi:peptidoglycan LD-endopeptidase CwlK